MGNKINQDVQLSASAKAVLACREEILKRWEEELKKEVAETNHVPHPILINNLPAFIQNIAEMISPDFPRRTATESNTLVSEHGSERARLTSYNPDVIISEYQIFRSCFFDVLKSSKVNLEMKELEMIHSSIDDAMKSAATAFTLVQNTIREQFIATLTHDLKNPLNAATMAAQLILRNSESTRVSVHAEKIIKNHRRMEKMINNLLDTMTLKTGGRLQLHLQLCDIHTIVSEVVHDFEHQQENTFEIEGGSVEGYWDADALRRSIENLISNAIKYGDPKSPITISIKTLHGRMILSVQNWGTPIPLKEQETIFQIFIRAEKAKKGIKGWGLGLPLIRGVAESHGGSIALDSSLERGTTFIFDIPLDSRPFLDAPVIT